MTSPPRSAERRDVITGFRRRLDDLIRGGDRRTDTRCLVLLADSGSGKTSILREVTADADVSIGWATAAELSWRAPYSVIGDALGRAVPDTLGADTDEYFLTAVDHWAGAGRCLLVLDDAHHADAASLNVLLSVVDAARDLPLTILVAARPLPQREYLTRLMRRADVGVVGIPPMDAMDLDVLVHDHHGAWPTARLQSALAPAQGNPLHATTILDDLDRGGALIRVGDRLDVARDAEPAPAAWVADSIAARIDSLEPSAHDLVVKLALWGGPTHLEDLAALSAVPAAALLTPAQALLGAGVADFDAAGRLATTHDAVTEVVTERTPFPLRAIVHRAIAERVGDLDPVARAFHLRSAGADPREIEVADDSAAHVLAAVPSVRADLLSDAVDAAAAAGRSTQLLSLERVLALARSGQLDRADEAARTALAVADDMDVIARLYRIRLFVLTARGAMDETIETIDSLAGVDMPERSRRVLSDLRNYVTLFGGRAPLPMQPYGPIADLTLTGLVAEALRSCLVGHTHQAVEYAAEASRRFMPTEPGPDGADSSEGASADLWPPFVELYHGGPRVAAETMNDTIMRERERGTDWQTTYRQLIQASILTVRGQLSDAAATYDTAFEKVAVGDEAVPSLAMGGRVMIDIARGDLASAERRVEDWEAGRVGHGVLVRQFGLPDIERQKMLIFEARRRHRPAAAMASAAWSGAIDQHAYAWAATISPACARIAVRAMEPSLLERIAHDLDTLLPRPLSPATAAPVRLATAIASADTAELVTIGVEVAAAAHDLDDMFLEVAGWEEAAVAAATAGDRDRAIDLARRALQRAEDAGADGLQARALSRMRAAGVRVTTAGRRRATTGWESLTPTESQVTELVAMGVSGPDIAARLFMSPRTVQTHVSHVLAKLGLRTRVELAAAASSRASG
jgi:DNA-binding CsgD family transcriptional regulator/tetratricopeptide (TPR) repeat protein